MNRLYKLLTACLIALTLAIAIPAAQAQIVLNRAFSSSQPTNPTGNATGGFLMAGLGVTGAGGGWLITPLQSGFVQFDIFGTIGNGTTGDGVTAAIVVGNVAAGAAPANGAAVPATTLATVCTNPTGPDYTALTGALFAPFHKTCFMQLTPNSQWWADLEIKDVTGGTTSLGNLQVSAKELN